MRFIELHIVNMDELQAQVEDIAALAKRAALLPAAGLPSLADLLAELLHLGREGLVTLVGEAEPKVTLGAGKLGVRVQLLPRVLEIVAAIRATELESK